jgi:hypothetical protein
LTRDDRFDPNWFLVELITPMLVNEDYLNSQILIKLESKHSSLIHDEHIRCWVKLIPTGIDPLKEKDGDAYLSYGYIMINGEDYVYE